MGQTKIKSVSICRCAECGEVWPTMAAVQAPLFRGRDLPKYCSCDREDQARQRCWCCPSRGDGNELENYGGHHQHHTIAGGE
jgi:hypothetical protein